MAEEGKIKDITSISDEDADKLSDEDLVTIEKSVSNPVFKKRINKLIGQRNVLREEKEGWTTKEKELLEEIAELGDYQKLKELANSDPRIAQGIMKGLNEALGKEGVKSVEGKIPIKVRDTGKDESDKSLEGLKQDMADLKIEKLFDVIGVKAEEIDQLTDFCKKRGYNMVDKTLLEMAYAKVFPKIEVEEDDKNKEPDSSTVSGINYGTAEVKTVRDAINFASKHLKKK